MVLVQAHRESPDTSPVVTIEALAIHVPSGFHDYQLWVSALAGQTTTVTVRGPVAFSGAAYDEV